MFRHHPHSTHPRANFAQWHNSPHDDRQHRRSLLNSTIRCCPHMHTPWPPSSLACPLRLTRFKTAPRISSATLPLCLDGATPHVCPPRICSVLVALYHSMPSLHAHLETARLGGAAPGAYPSQRLNCLGAIRMGHSPNYAWYFLI